ncbi:IPT/TIG domain-containing protein [Paenibacillus sp. MMS18-CY102]|uniref:IPT/TIG domain-containing protein n=1 Tax=Paenibacillus sp. MMS18-CY102 TaxID=2682849 RepID=UPI0013666229|nr:IPT/TIG domain-containing protein [Paenibacillus sp. MMS18-CY102]MWC30909.1 VWA domain-containing protein [Paenibacillus sp. MMS18-CY102]
MRGIKQKVALVLSFLMMISILSTSLVAFATTNDYVSITRSVNPAVITTEQEAEVSLTVKGSPPVGVVMPNDVVLIIDKSGSMAPDKNGNENKMKNAKEAAQGFIDLMDLTKHRVGIVDFSSKDKIGSYNLSTDKEAVKSYIAGITADGDTATGDAIQVAKNMLDNHRPEAQPVIVILTDGDATRPETDPYGFAKSKAKEAKDAGIVFYTIALLKTTDNPLTSGPNKLLKEMATTSDHHHFVLGSTGLSEIYAAIVAEIGLASAYDVVIKDTVGPNFEIVPGSYDNNIPKPTVTGKTLVWDFKELKNNDLTFTYKIRPVNKNVSGHFYTSESTSVVEYKDYAGAERSKEIPNSIVQVKFPAPQITSIVESSGSPTGGETVTLNGKYFRDGATVTIGSSYAANLVVSENKATFTTPPGAQGNAVVTLQNPDGQQAQTEYQYKANPVIDSITPNNGPLEGGNSVTVNGKFIMQGVKVEFDGIAGTVTTNNGNGYLIVKVPAGAESGLVDVKFTNPDATSTTVEDGYSYDAPPVVVLEITKVEPNHGALAGGERVYLDGVKFQQDTKVYFGGVEATDFLYMSSGRISVNTPAGVSPGQVDVKVVNTDGETFTLEDAFTYDEPPVLAPPTVTGVDPNNGPMDGGAVVYVNGSNFVPGLKLFIGNSEATVYNVYPSRIIAGTPSAASAGEVDVKVVNPDGKNATLTNGYEYLAPPPPPAPTISGMSPNAGPLEGGEAVYIDGSNYLAGAKVFIGDVEATVYTIYPTRILAVIPASSVGGKVDVKVVNPDGQEATLADGYEYVIPVPIPVTITNISPDTGLLSGGDVVYIDGTGFKPGAKVKFGNIEIDANFMAASRVYVIAPSTTVAGKVDITVTNPDGMTDTKTDAYTYTAPIPTISVISPGNGFITGGTVIYIDGNNFEASMTVKIGGIVVPIEAIYGNYRIMVTTPQVADPGTVPVEVKLVSGNSATAQFIYNPLPPTPPPVITSVYNTDTSPSGGYVAYIDGADFGSGAKVYYGTQEATTVYMYGSYRILVYVPAGSGTVPIKVVNPDGKVSNTIDFTYQ